MTCDMTIRYIRTLDQFVLLSKKNEVQNLGHLLYLKAKDEEIANVLSTIA